MWVTDCSLFTPGENYTDTVVIITVRVVHVIVRLISKKKQKNNSNVQDVFAGALVKCHKLIHVILCSLFIFPLLNNLDELTFFLFVLSKA